MIIELLYYVTVKSIINRIRKYPFMILGVTICFFAVLLIPLLFLDNGYFIQIPDNILNAFFFLYFTFCLFKIAMDKNGFRTIPLNLETLVVLVPEKTKKIYRCLVWHTIAKTIISYGIIFLCIKLYAKGALDNVLLSLVLLIINVTTLVLISSIIDLLSLIKKATYIKLIVGLFAVFHSVMAVLELFGRRPFGTLFDNILPPYIYATALSSILDNKPIKLCTFITSVILFLLVLISYVIVIYKAEIKGSDIVRYQHLPYKSTRYFDLLKIEKYIKFFPKNIRLLWIKEWMQIVSEKEALLNIFVQTILAASIMLISAITIDSEAMQIIEMGIFVALAYMSFILALYSIPRETNTIWIYKTLKIKKEDFVLAKFFVNYFVSFLLSNIVLLLYLLLATILTGNTIIYMEKIIHGYLWSIITTLPLSTIWGIGLGAMLPYKVITKKRKITYKFNGIEGVLLTILVFVVVTPAFLISQMSQYLAFDIVYWLYVITMFICMLYLAGKTYKKMN